MLFESVALILSVILIIMIVSLAINSKKLKKSNLIILDYSKKIETSQIEREDLLVSKQQNQDLREQIQNFRVLQEDREKQISLEKLDMEKLFEHQRNEYITEYEIKIKDIEDKAKEANKKSKLLGESVVKGELTQVIGTFGIVAQYDHFSLITSVSKQASFDGIGVKDDSLDFIEFKSPGARLSGKEGLVKKLISNGKVGYRIIDVEIDIANLLDRE